MTQYILSTCGTSLLTNGASPTVLRLLLATADRPAEGLTADDRRTINRRLAEARSHLTVADGDEAAAATAELTALRALERASAAGRSRYHLLVYSDTFQGTAVARVLAQWLRQRGEAVNLLTATGLRPGEPAVLRLALAELAGMLVNEVTGWRKPGNGVVFNLTGGFKPVQAFLQLLGCVLADETVYVFEGGERQLYRLPRLPVRVEPDEALRPHLGLLRRLAAGERISRTQAAALPEALILAAGDELVLSEWGHVVWATVSRHSPAAGV